MGININRPTSPRFDALIKLLDEMDRAGRDIAGNDTGYDESAVMAFADKLETVAFDWGNELFGEGVHVEAHDAMSTLAGVLEGNVERRASANSRDACRTYHAEIQHGAR